MLFSEDSLPKSKVFENIIINQLKANFFWRDPYKNEVDAIVGNKEIVPIEIKYGKIDFNGLIKFMDKFNVKEGIVISKDEEREQNIDGKIIHIIPAFKFLLKQQHAE